MPNKAYRRGAKGTRYPKITLSMSADDKKLLAKIQALYLEQTRLSLSASTVVSLALGVLYDHVEHGDLRLQARHHGFKDES